MKMQGVLTVQPALNQPASKNIFDIQLNYNSNQALDPKSWDCYNLRSLEWDNKTTLVLSNTRELDRVPSTE